MALLTVFLAVAFSPLFTCSPLPLADYPNHLARMYIISSFDNSPPLQRYYEIHWHLIPNLALDIIVPKLAHFMSVERAMLIFTALTLVLLVVGCFALHRVLFGGLSYAPFSCFLLLYNRQFLWGMLNYLFSVGLALVTFALWVATRQKSLGIRCVILVMFAMAVFISHLGGFGILGILIFGYEVNSFAQEKDYRALRNAVIAAITALGLPLLLFVLFSPTRHRVTPFEPWELKNRLIGLVDAFNNYAIALDAATFLLAMAAIGLGLLLRKAHLHPRMYVALVSLSLLYWVINSQLLGSQGVARRLIPALFLILACSLEWNVPKRYFLAVIALAFLVRTVVVVQNWSSASSVFGENLAVIDQIPRGAKVAAAVGELNFPQLNNPPLGHFPNMAVVRRQVLINSLFAYDGLQPLGVKPEYQSLVPAGVYSQLYEVDVSKAPLTATANPFERIPLGGYDFLLMVNRQYFRYPVPRMLRPVQSSANTVLYQVIH